MVDLLNSVDIEKFRDMNYIPHNRYKHNVDVSLNVLRDMEIYTDTIKEAISNQTNIKYVKELESYRVFNQNSLISKGIIFADYLNVLNRFRNLKHTMIAKADNHFLEKKYLLPIKLINGEVFTFMAYDVNQVANRYSMPTVKGLKSLNYSTQGNLLGNLDSIERIDSRDIYFAEGFFDAYRIEEQMKVPGVAILGSVLTRNKFRLLTELKRRLGKRFIYIPDIDMNKAGTSDQLLNSGIWDKIFDFNLEFNTDKTYKDIDAYFRSKLLEEKN